MSVAAAILDELSEKDLAALAERLRPYMRDGDDRWLDANDAAAYLGMPRSTLHKLTSAGAIPFSQDCPGGKLYFKRSALDAWRG